MISTNQNPWILRGGGADWQEALHSFTWLSHFAAADGDATRRQVRWLIDGWIRRYGRFDPVVWRPDLTAVRLIAWTCHFHLLLEGTDMALRRVVVDSYTRQLRWLAAATTFQPPGSALVTMEIALIFGLLSRGQRGRSLGRRFRRLDDILSAQVLPDGGHASRNPKIHLDLLARLVHLREALTAGGIRASETVIHTIDRLAPVVRFFRLGDGGFATFHGADPADPAQIERVLALAAPNGKAPARCPHLGFERLVAKNTVLIMDVGGVPAPGYTADYHTAPLAFEMSVGRERMVVSCGAALGLSAEWRRVATATAAHSTLILDDMNAVTLIDDKDIGRRPLLPAPITSSNRNETDGQIWIEASHSGYVSRLGVVHRRHLWLSEEGDDLRGEERIEPKGRGMWRNLPYDLRFHFAPDVRVGVIGDGNIALIRMPSGEDWRLRAVGGQLSVNVSISVAEPGPPRRAEQLVLTGTTSTGGQAILRWALSRFEARPAEL